MKVGIDALALYTPHYSLDLSLLAEMRGFKPDKYQTGMGQYTMSVPPPGEDIVTMAANAAERAIQGIHAQDIDLLLFATESGIDQSKAAGIYVHDWLGLSPHCRIVELKQACYSATAGLRLALPYLRENPHKKVLLIASDIARYGLATPGESSQGGAAVAMVLSAHPRLLAIEPEAGFMTENVMDFWRPNYLSEALVEGKYSSKLYLTMLEKVWAHYSAASGRTAQDHAYYCYHTPVPRLVETAHLHLSKLNGNSARQLSEDAAQKLDDALYYARHIGNSYAASLYIGLASLFDLAQEDLSNQRIGFYSYGSGCVAEFFSGMVQPGYQNALQTAYHRELLARRQPLTYDEYLAFYRFHYREDGGQQSVPVFNTGKFRLAGMQAHKRIYENVEAMGKSPLQAGFIEQTC